MLIGDLIRRRAVASPGLEFWRDHDLSISYDQVNRDANRIARGLLAEDLSPGDHVAICSANCYEYAAAHFGAAKAGMVLVHLNPRFTAVELLQLTGHSDSRLVIAGGSQAGKFESIRDQLPDVVRWVGLPDGEEPSADWMEPIGEWVEDQSEEEPDLSHYAVRPGAPAVFPESPLQLLYTSGTTGFPKGALISHGAKIRHGTTHVVNLGLRLGDRLYSTLPLCHQFAQWLVLVTIPVAGATLITAPGFEPGTCWEALHGEGITHLACVPTMLYRLLDHPEGAGEAPPDLRNIVYGGAPMEAKRIEDMRVTFPGTALFQGFGQTEVGYCLGLHGPDHAIRPDSVGKPDLFSEVLLLDEDGKKVPQGSVGEIVVATPYLMNGYYKDPAATADFFAFGQDWGRTGDLAQCDEDGYYMLAGRKVDMVISGGVNIYPLEIERVLETHPDVAEAAVFGIPHPDWGETIHATVALNPQKDGATELSEEALTEYCREQLAGFKIPRSFSFADNLPRTATGKVLKYQLRAPFWENLA